MNGWFLESLDFVSEKIEFSDIDAVLFDLDGTVYEGGRLVDGAREAIDFFRRSGIRTYFITNNSAKTRDEVRSKLTGMGVACELEEVVTSGYLAAALIKREGLSDVFVFGTASLEEELNLMGVRSANPSCAENLLIGFDPAADHDRFAEALRVALRADRIIACNKERSYPGQDGLIMPGCGAVVSAMEWAASRECDLVVGKPSSRMIDYLSTRDGIEVERILVVGDTLESDIAMARRAGCRSVLVGRSRDSGSSPVPIGAIPALFGFRYDSIELSDTTYEQVGSSEACCGLRIERSASPERMGEVWGYLSDRFRPPLRSAVQDFDVFTDKLAEKANNLICLDGDKVAGCISFYSNDFETKCAFVSAVAVAAAYKGNGLGNLMLQTAAKVSKSAGMTELRLEVRKDNVSAIRFYEGLGFFQTGESEVSLAMRAFL